MKKFIIAVLPAMALLALSSCHGGKGSANGLPKGFEKMSDTARVAAMMERVAPDSLARFIIYGALGKNPDAKIDTLAIATNYAYEHLRGDDLNKFANEYDAVIASLPLAEKMKAYLLGGTEDPQGLGYQLGLEYMQSIRDNHKNAAQVESELKEFRKACGNDRDTYRRFIIGFKTVLKVDGNKAVPRDIYNKFINWPED